MWSATYPWSCSLTCKNKPPQIYAVSRTSSCQLVRRFQLAVGLTTQRFALVFGVNTFAAVALNTVLTIILIDRAGFALDVETQFIVYR